MAIFGAIAAASGLFGYQVLHRWIEVRAHTLPSYEAPFYISMAGFILLFAAATGIAWRAWRGWALAATLLLVSGTVVGLVIAFWLPFP
jgi:hypothetical protein